MLGPRILASPPTQSLTVMKIGSPGSTSRRRPRRAPVQAMTFHGRCHRSILRACWPGSAAYRLVVPVHVNTEAGITQPPTDYPSAASCIL